MSDDKHLERLRAMEFSWTPAPDAVAWAVAEIGRLRSLVDVTREARDEATDVAKANVQREVAQLRAAAIRLEEQLACCCDLVNSWCRESGIKECGNPYLNLGLREAVDRLWSKLSGEANTLRQKRDQLRSMVEALRHKVERLNFHLEYASQMQSGAELIREYCKLASDQAALDPDPDDTQVYEEQP